MRQPPNIGRKKLIAIIAGLMVVGAGLAVWLARRGPSQDFVQLANGFEFPVTVKVTAEGGKESTLTLPPKSRTGADFEGEYTLEFSSPKGVMQSKKYTFATGDKRKKGCFQYVNVLGSAAIIEEEVVYGVGIKGSNKLLSGEHFVGVCPRWGFETEKPPEAVTVKQGKIGIDLKWLHYIGEGDWHASIGSLLALKPRVGDQPRIKAWNLAVAMSKHDPDNARFKALGPQFKQACTQIIDMFEGTAMAGKAQRDCLANANAVFPGN